MGGVSGDGDVRTSGWSVAGVGGRLTDDGEDGWWWQGRRAGDDGWMALAADDTEYRLSAIL